MQTKALFDDFFWKKNGSRRAFRSVSPTEHPLRRGNRGRQGMVGRFNFEEGFEPAPPPV